MWPLIALLALLGAPQAIPPTLDTDRLVYDARVLDCGGAMSSDGSACFELRHDRLGAFVILSDPLVPAAKLLKDALDKGQRVTVTLYRGPTIVDIRDSQMANGATR